MAQISIEDKVAQFRTVLSRNGRLEVLQYIASSAIGRYTGEIYNKSVLTKKVIDNSIADLEKVRLIHGVPDVRTPEPGAKPYTVTRWELTLEYGWLADEL